MSCRYEQECGTRHGTRTYSYAVLLCTVPGNRIRVGHWHHCLGPPHEYYQYIDSKCCWLARAASLEPSSVMKRKADTARTAGRHCKLVNASITDLDKDSLPLLLLKRKRNNDGARPS